MTVSGLRHSAWVGFVHFRGFLHLHFCAERKVRERGRVGEKRPHLANGTDRRSSAPMRGLLRQPPYSRRGRGEGGGGDQGVEPAHQVPVVGDAQGAFGAKQGYPQGRQLLSAIGALLVNHLHPSHVHYGCLIAVSSRCCYLCGARRSPCVIAPSVPPSATSQPVLPPSVQIAQPKTNRPRPSPDGRLTFCPRRRYAAVQADTQPR